MSKVVITKKNEKLSSIEGLNHCCQNHDLYDFTSQENKPGKIRAEKSDPIKIDQNHKIGPDQSDFTIPGYGGITYKSCKSSQLQDAN